VKICDIGVVVGDGVIGTVVHRVPDCVREFTELEIYLLSFWTHFLVNPGKIIECR
jgi:hypothetical protein